MSTISTLPARVMGSQPVAPLVRLFERALLAAGSLLIRLLAPPLKRRATNDLVERALDERFPAAPNPRAAEMTGGLTIYPNGVLTPMEKRTTEPATPAALAKIWVPNKQEPLGAWFDLTPRSLVLLFRAMARVAGVELKTTDLLLRPEAITHIGRTGEVSWKRNSFCPSSFVPVEGCEGWATVTLPDTCGWVAGRFDTVQGATGLNFFLRASDLGWRLKIEFLYEDHSLLQHYLAALAPYLIFMEGFKSPFAKFVVLYGQPALEAAA